MKSSSEEKEVHIPWKHHSSLAHVEPTNPIILVTAPFNARSFS